jgi:hypothetical protein
MAFQLAPWLQPPDFLAAIRSGADLGLQVRAADQRQAEAAARQQEAMAQLQQSWAEKMMANQTSQKQLAANSQYRMDNLGLENQRNLTTASHYANMEQNALSGQKLTDAHNAATLAETIRHNKQAENNPAYRVSQTDMLDRAAFGRNLDMDNQIENLIMSGKVSDPTEVKNLRSQQGSLRAANSNIVSRATQPSAGGLPSLGTAPVPSPFITTDSPLAPLGPQLQIAPPNQGNMYAPSLALTASPASGTGEFLTTDSGPSMGGLSRERAEAAAAIAAGAPAAAVSARFKAKFGRDL